MHVHCTLESLRGAMDPFKEASLEASLHVAYIFPQ